MLREIKMQPKTRWLVSLLCKYLLVVLGITLYTIIVARAAGVKAERRYDAWRDRYVADFLAQRDAAEAGMPIDPVEAQLDAEAQALARVLYGVKDNSTDDLRTYCWCMFNRADSPDYPDSLEEVIEQPAQWMRYDPENPVLDSLYQLARAELEAWHNGATRPCAPDFIYMTWSPSEIVLRNTWTNSSSTRYWRIKE